MAFKGYHLKIDGVIIPLKYTCNFKCSPFRRTDKGSSVNTQGVLKRKILPHKRTGATWNTGYTTDADMTFLNTNIFEKRDNMSVECWIAATQSYETITCYAPDMEFETLMIINNVNYYRPIELEIIQY